MRHHLNSAQGSASAIMPTKTWRALAPVTYNTMLFSRLATPINQAVGQIGDLNDREPGQAAFFASTP
jgi:hypothetical protein